MMIHYSLKLFLFFAFLLGMGLCLSLIHGEDMAAVIDMGATYVIQKAKQCDEKTANMWITGIKPIENGMMIKFHDPGNKIKINVWGYDLSVYEPVIDSKVVSVYLGKDDKSLCDLDCCL